MEKMEKSHSYKSTKLFLSRPYVTIVVFYERSGSVSILMT